MGFVIGPIGPTGTPAAHTPLPLSVARGEYLANHVASCVNCHTDRNERDGSLVGPRFGGGQRMEVADDRTRIYVPPNLTPDPETSPIGMWSEDDFVARMRGGERIPGTPMPWGAYGRMSDDDLRSLYRYFRTLPPYRHETGPRVQPK
jgi:cytochrome c553